MGTISVQLNGEVVQTTSTTLFELLSEYSFTEKKIAIEYNKEIVPKSQSSAVKLKANDSIEIVHFVGGG